MKPRVHAGLRIADCGLRTAGCAGRGFTLVEMVVSLGISAVLMLGIGSAMLFAARAMPDAKTPTGAIVDAGGALERIITELQYAVTVNSRSATMIEFTVADRDGNDVPETIRYEWSGTAGAPLTRQYNAGPVVEVLPDVRDFALSYDLQTISTQMPQGNESAETVLRSFSAQFHTESFPIKSSEWYGQYFFPTLPADDGIPCDPTFVLTRSLSAVVPTMDGPMIPPRPSRPWHAAQSLATKSCFPS
jgi:prepilin-type N-terminal cleavage/methylation domain-containing protein